MTDNDRKGHLFVFEGVDGVGKSTIVNQVMGYLEEDGYKPFKLREPTRQTKDSDKIIELMGDPLYDITTPEHKHELDNYYIADRIWDIDHNVRPALKRGELILMDRYYHSAAVYQSTKDRTLKNILEYNREFLKAPVPDVTFLLTALPEVVNDRILGRHPQAGDNMGHTDQISKEYETLFIQDYGNESYIMLYNHNQWVTAATITNIIKLVMEL
jgi:dTMP kinase